MHFSAPPTLMRALTNPPDTAKDWSELAARLSRSIPPAAVANGHQANGRCQVEERAAATNRILGREAVVTRIRSLTYSILG